MPYRIALLALALVCLAALAGATVNVPALPSSAAPAAVAPAPAATPDWLQPAVSTPGKPAKLPGTEAPLGAIFKDACSSACLQDESACFNGCGGDHSCNVNCSNDYYCCLRTCDPFLPQCP